MATIINLLRLLFGKDLVLDNYEKDFIAGLAFDAFIGMLFVMALISKGFIR